ncbi:hypothetical protein BDFG_05608 [Blastomyces dermatitidis ATCC 26199]|nr:hypothetical protein BDFG_05608 [Blastomyces dermatitidis ATCC 26199]
MSLKKKSTAVKTGAASMMKKALILEKLFQSLSQEEHDALLHISDREEKTEEDVEMNEEKESQKTAAEAADNEELQVELKQNDKLTHSSMSIMQDLTVKRLVNTVSIIERLTGHNNLLFEESVPGFEKTAAEKINVNNIIEISDTEKKDDLTIVLMKRMSISFKCKMLSLIALKFSKYV